MGPIYNIIPTFAGGEFSPTLHSRVDLEKYATGLKTCRNMIVHPYGGASNRPGTLFVANAKFNNGSIKLIPFVFNNGDTYMIEMGTQYFRFYRNGVQVVNGASGNLGAWTSSLRYHKGDIVTFAGVPFKAKDNNVTSSVPAATTPPAAPASNSGWLQVLATEAYEVPHSLTSVQDVKFVQSGDVIFFAHPDAPPFMLTRLADNHWRCQEIGSDNPWPGVSAFENNIVGYPSLNGEIRNLNKTKGPYMLQNTDTKKTMTLSQVTIDGELCYKLTSSEPIFNVDGANMKYMKISVPITHENIAFSGAHANFFNYTSTDYQAKGTWRIETRGVWNGNVRVQKKNNDGTYSDIFFHKSEKFGAINVNTFGYLEELTAIRLYVYGNSQTGPDGVSGTGTISVNFKIDSFIYDMHVGIYEVIDALTAKVVAFDDVIFTGIASSTWSEGSWSPKRGYPSAIEFYQDRLALSSSQAEPQTNWFSKTSNYYNFGISSPLVDSDGMSVNIPSRRMNSINNTVALHDLIAFTESADWRISSGQNSIFGPSTVEQRVNGYTGSSYIAPLVIGNRCIFAQAGSKIVRDLGYDFQANSYLGDELGIFSRHILETSEIKDWAYQQHPDSIIWIVKEDGSLASLTYNKAQQVAAWSQHETDGKFLAVATLPIPESSLYSLPYEGFNEVWFVVERDDERFIERMMPRVNAGIEDLEYQYFLDCGLTLNQVIAIEDITLANPLVIDTFSNHGLVNGNTVEFDDVTFFEDDLSDISDQMNGNRFVVSNVTATTFQVNIDAAELVGTFTGGRLRKAVTVITGLSHLNGKEVSIVADGNLLAPVVVTGGQVTLPGLTTIAHVGLPYASVLETLALELRANDGTMLSRKMKVSEAVIKVMNSKGGQIGSNSNHLEAMSFPVTAEIGGPTPLFSGDYKQTLYSEFEEAGRVYIRQGDPYPITINAIIPKITTGS